MINNADVDNDRWTIGGNHQAEKTDEDVLAVIFRTSRVASISNKMFSQFKNLIYLQMDNSYLNRESSFTGAYKLLRFDGAYNSVTDLPAKSFVNCKSLRYVDLYMNAIETVDLAAFEGLTN